MASKKVVFFFPAFSSKEATAPLGILAVSTPLLRAGYEVRIVDSTITPNFKLRVIEELSDALCLAVSLVTGPMIRETVEIARTAKQMYPHLPVVLGGWHPSLLPHQTLAAEYVDIVVVGQGEDAFLEVVRQNRGGRESLKGVPGVGYKEHGQIVFNARRGAASNPGTAAQGLSTGGFRRLRARLRPALGNVHEQSRLPLQLRDTAPTTRSMAASGTRWNPEQVGEEMCDLASRYGLQFLWVVDDNFLVDRDRALGIAEGICRRGVKFEWSIQASINLVVAVERRRMEADAPRGPFASRAGRRHRLAEDHAADEQGLSEAWR